MAEGAIVTPPRDRWTADDGERIARIEERLEQESKHVGRRIDDLQDAMTRGFSDLKDSLTKTVNGRIETLEERYKIVRTIVLFIAGGILAAFLNSLIAGWTGSAPVKFPQAAPYHSTQEPKETIRR